MGRATSSAYQRHGFGRLAASGFGMAVLSVMIFASSGVASANTAWEPVIIENSLGDCMSAGIGTRLTPITTVPLGDCTTFTERSVSGGIEVADGVYDIGESGGQIKLETPSASTVLVVGAAWSLGGHSYNDLSIIRTSDYLSPSPYNTPLQILSNGGPKNSWRWPKN